MNDDGMMTRERLGELLDAFGGNLHHWPEPFRWAAEALIARDPAAHLLFDRAHALDALLDQAPVMRPSPALKARLIERAAPSSWRQSLAALWPFGPAWQPAAAFALIAALGIALGPLIGETERAAPASSEIDVLGLGLALDEGDLP